MRDIFSIPDPHNKDNKWYILLHQSIFPLEYLRRHVHSLQKGYDTDQYVVQNLKWSGMYLMNILSNTLLQKVLTLVLLTEIGNDVFVAIMNTFLSDSYDDLEETLNNIKSLKLKSYTG